MLDFLRVLIVWGFIVFSIISIVKAKKSVKAMEKDDFMIEPLNDREVLVLRHAYDKTMVFHYIVKRLEAKKYLVKKELDEFESIEKAEDSMLLGIERKVFELFKTSRYISKIDINKEFNEVDLRRYYEQTNEHLTFRGLVLDMEAVKERKRIYEGTLQKILIGSILGNIFVLPSGSFLTRIAVMLLVPTSLFFIMKNAVKTHRITKKGRKSLEAYIKNYRSACCTQVVSDRGSYEFIMATFLVGKNQGIIESIVKWDINTLVGINAINYAGDGFDTSSNNNICDTDFGGECECVDSACDSGGGSCSSCTSCSSCGGGGD
ncbi:MAG: hypothetical protein ACRC6T_14635 [Sarcina sp.]